MTNTIGFNRATRRNRRRQTTIEYKPNTNTTYDISRVGFLGNIFIGFDGTVKAKHASKTTFAKAAFAPFNLLERAMLKLNSGTVCVDISGKGLYQYNVATKLNSIVDKVLEDGVFVFDNVCSTAGTANKCKFNLKIPVSINDRDTLGMLLLQSQQIVAALSIATANGSVLTSDSDVEMEVTGNWNITFDTFDVPADVANYPNLGFLHQILEDRTTITGTGEKRLPLPMGNIYMRLINAVTIDGVQTLEGVDKVSLKYNLSTIPTDLGIDDILAINRDELGRSMPLGCFLLDFTNQGMPSMGSDRDWIDSAGISEFDEAITISSGADLGTNNNYIDTIRDMLIPLN